MDLRDINSVSLNYWRNAELQKVTVPADDFSSRSQNYAQASIPVAGGAVVTVDIRGGSLETGFNLEHKDAKELLHMIMLHADAIATNRMSPGNAIAEAHKIAGIVRALTRGRTEEGTPVPS